MRKRYLFFGIIGLFLLGCLGNPAQAEESHSRFKLPSQLKQFLNRFNDTSSSPATANAPTKTPSPAPSSTPPKAATTPSKPVSKQPAPAARVTPPAPKPEPVSNIIKAIEVTGNRHIKESLIRNEITLSPDQELDEYVLNRNLRNIKSLGIFEDVQATILAFKGGKKIIITVRENPKITRIQFYGSTVFSASELQEKLSSKEGDLLNLRDVRDDIEIIKQQYENQGYLQARIYSVDTPEKDGDPLIFRIGEGIIDEIVITGNTKTRDYVIRRELSLKPGQPLNATSLRSDLRKVFNLNYFTNVEPEFIPGKDPYSYTLRINVNERPTNATFSLGGAISPTSGFSFFTDLFWDNVFGTGQLVLLRAQLGRANTYQFKYHNPWMWDERKSFTFRYWYQVGSVESINPLNSSIDFIGQESKGVEVGVGIPITYEFKTNHSVKWESVRLTDINDSYRIQSYRLNLGYDTRDVWFNPREGVYHTFQVEKAFPFTQANLEFTRYDLELRNFFPTFENQTLATRAAFGVLQSAELDTPRLDREVYRVGGSFTVRGFDDFNPFAVGNKQMLFSTEYRFLFNQTFQALLFVDTGYATSATYNKIHDLWSQFRVGKGVGLRINIPGMGPLRLDYGIDDQGIGRVHFNLGHAF